MCNCLYMFYILSKQSIFSSPAFRSVSCRNSQVEGQFDVARNDHNCENYRTFGLTLSVKLLFFPGDIQQVALVLNRNLIRLQRSSVRAIVLSSQQKKLSLTPQNGKKCNSRLTDFRWLWF